MSDEVKTELEKKYEKQQEQAEANVLSAVIKLAPKKELTDILDPSMKALMEYK